jgi:predicted nucleic acid-binding protein
VIATLVDSNVILDILTEDPEWQEWSAAALASQADAGPLVVNPLIYAEVAARFDRIEDLEEALPAEYFLRQPLPWEAAFLAGRSFIQCRRKGGQRRSPLPDFYIGAHAVVGRMTLLTRDARRYRSYFPGLRVVAP